MGGHMNPAVSRLSALMGSASLLTLTTALGAHAQQVAQAQMAQASPQVPEQVLVTGSLIHGTAAVGVPVTNLGVQDFTQTGNVTIGDLFRTIPIANVAPGPSAVNSGGHQERETRVNIRGLDGTGPRSLLMVDGVRFPPQADGLCAIDPSIIPALALDRVDILADGASATYGSDAIAGVINVILKRNFNGAVTLLHYQQTDSGGQQFQASQLYGRTWEGGGITLTYEWINENEVRGTAHSNYTINYSPWGLDNEIPIGASIPGTVSTGAPTVNNGAGVAGVGTNCGNCFAVPAGTGANFNPALNNGAGPSGGSSAATLSWAQLLAHAGVNQVDPLKMAWEEGAQQKNSFAVTFDQRLFPGVSFFANGYYSNRRIQEVQPAFYSGGVSSNELRTYTVPTTNPYYPTGAPPGLRVSYDFAREVPPHIPAYELSYRYHFGLNLDLPFSWSGQIYDSRSYETAQYHAYRMSGNVANIALGNTVGGITKPATLPYLNLFCDPTAFQCNSPATLAYIGVERVLGVHYAIEEKGGRFDGPLLDLPAGQIKAAVGGTYESDNTLGYDANGYANLPAQGSSIPPPIAPILDPQPYTVWAGFVQVDIPIFGDNFNIPLVRKLDLEGSWRHDQYHGTLNGGTSNPKVAFTWLINDVVGATVRGSWGTSFRFANAGEYSTVLSDANGSFNFPSQPTIAVLCTGGRPAAGGLFADLFAAGFGCGSTPGGVNWAGGPHPELRSFVNAATGQVQTREGGTALAPEKSNNYSLGFELAPQIDFLRGLDLQATWYSVKVNGTLLGFNQNSDSTVAQPSQRFHYILPSDLGCPVAANANPGSCAPFQAMVVAALSDRNTTLDVSQATTVRWLSDASTVGIGFLRVEGVDWNASYDLDLGDFGAWNTGITSTYYMHRISQTVPGTPIIDAFHQDLAPVGGLAQNGVETLPRFIYRARLGWSDGPYSFTTFLNHQSHFFETRVGTPPNVNFQCIAAGGTVGGGTFPCSISNYSNIVPPWYTIDLSLGYNTCDLPANDYLKRITIQLTVQDLLNKHSPFAYGPTTSVRNASAYEIIFPNSGRTIGITLIKTW